MFYKLYFFLEIQEKDKPKLKFAENSKRKKEGVVDNTILNEAGKFK